MFSGESFDVRAGLCLLIVEWAAVDCEIIDACDEVLIDRLQLVSAAFTYPSAVVFRFVCSTLATVKWIC